MNDIIYDTGTIAWAVQRAREASDIPRYREKIDHLKQLLSFINDWCKRGEFDEWVTDFCNKNFTEMFNEASPKIGEVKAYIQAGISFLNFYKKIDDLKYNIKPPIVYDPLLEKLKNL